MIDYDGRDSQNLKKKFCDKFSMMKNLMWAVIKSLQSNCIGKFMKCTIVAKTILHFMQIFPGNF